MKFYFFFVSLIFSNLVFAQSRTYAPGVIQIPIPNIAQYPSSRAKSSSSSRDRSTFTIPALKIDEVISPDDPFAAQKTMRAQYRMQVAALNAQIALLDKMIDSSPPASSNTNTNSKTSTASTNSSGSNISNTQTSTAKTATNYAAISEARKKFAEGNIEGALPVQRNFNGSSTDLTCPAGYLYHNPSGSILTGKEICVPIPSEASNTTVTPGNKPIPPTKSSRGTMDQCPEGYIATSYASNNYQIMCTPRITEIAPGKYSCLESSEWPEVDANGKMNCVGTVNKNGSVRVCSEDAIATQDCAPGYYYSKKTKKYYPTYEAASAASGYGADPNAKTIASEKPRNDIIRDYLLAYNEDIVKPENVAKIKKDALDNGVSASEIDKVMGWPEGTSQGAFNQVP